MKLSLHRLGQIVEGVGTYLEFPDMPVGRIRTDSRVVGRGDVFVCLQGERFDGHNFAIDAVNAGACVVVTERWLPELPPSTPLILVKDTYGALRRLATYKRHLFGGKVIGVTGSCGKTTVKELVYSILSVGHRVGKNFKNWNNTVGVPLSIFDFKGDEDFWVLEAGINQKGEMDLLGEMIAPDVVIIHNIGPVHLEGLGSVEGVAREKAKLMDYLSERGFAVINNTYPFLVREAEQRGKETLFFGKSTPYFSTFEGYGSDFKGKFRCHLDKEEIEVRLPLAGSTFEENLTASAVCCWRLGVRGKEIKQGMEALSLPEHRSHIFKSRGLVVVDDCYNANPVSMERVLMDIARLKRDGEFVAVLGDMLELGKDSESHHEHLGEVLVQAGVDLLVYKGEFFEAVKKGINRKGGRLKVYEVKNIREFESLWREVAPERGIVLIKASRGIRLDEFVRSLREGEYR